jgi:hypothetical protein
LFAVYGVKLDVSTAFLLMWVWLESSPNAPSFFMVPLTMAWNDSTFISGVSANNHESMLLTAHLEIRLAQKTAKQREARVRQLKESSQKRKRNSHVCKALLGTHHIRQLLRGLRHQIVFDRAGLFYVCLCQRRRNKTAKEQ